MAWNTAGQWHKGHLLLWEPETVYTAQVDAATTANPGGRYLGGDTFWLIKPKNASGSVTAVEDGMTITLGTTAGGRDLGVACAKGWANDGTLGLCVRVWASPGRNWGELDVTTDAYITVLDLRQPWARMPKILASTGGIQKDGVKGNVYNKLYPVAHGGAGYAGEVDTTTGLATVSFTATNSYATAPGAAISTYAWDVDDGSITVGTSSDVAITATFPPGERYVKLTVTDDNSNSHSTFIPVVTSGRGARTEASYSGASLTSSGEWVLGPVTEAFDNDNDSNWLTGAGIYTGWAACEFTAAKTVSEIGLVMPFFEGSFQYNTWRDFTLDYWNGSAWVPVVTETDYDSWEVGTETIFTFTAVTAAKWRASVTDTNTVAGDKVGLAEFNIYDDDAETVKNEIDSFEVVSRVLRPEGQTVTFRVYDDIPATTYPYGTLAMYWEDEYYGDTQESLYGPTGRKHMRFVGWIATEPTRIEPSESGTLPYVDLVCKDVAGWLAQLPGFSQLVQRDASPSNFDQLIGLNIDRYVWYLLYWHSTALDIAPFTWAGGGETYAVPTLGSNGASLYEQANLIAGAADCVLTCDSFGRLAMKADPNRQPTGDRTSTVMQALDADDFSALDYTEQRPSTHHWLWLGGIEVDTTDADSLSGGEVVTYFCRAPGETPGQGLTFVQKSEMVVADQDDLNERAGHQYARLNADQSRFTLQLVHSNDGGIEPAYMQWVTLTLTSDYAAQRGLTFDTERFLPFEVSIVYDPDAGTKEVTVVMEREVTGAEAVTYIPDKGSVPTYEDYYPGSWDITPAGGISLSKGMNQVAAFDDNGYLLITTTFQNSSPSYTLTDLSVSGTPQVWCADPFSAGYINGTGQIDGWLVTSTNIYKVSDLFGSASASSQKTFRTPSGDIATHSIDASFGTDGAACVVSYYGEDGTYVTYTTDGSSWSAEAQLTAYYQTDTTTYDDISPGCYASPKTAGLVYTTAFKSNNSPAGYVSTDYGANWSETNGANGPVMATGLSLADDIHVPYNHADELKAYYGAVTAGVDYVTGGWYLGDALDQFNLNTATQYNHLREAAADDAYMLAIYIEGLTTDGTNDTVKRMSPTHDSPSAYDHAFTYDGSDHLEDEVNGNGDVICFVGSSTVAAALWTGGENVTVKNENENTYWSQTLVSPVANATDVLAACIETVGSGRGGNVTGGICYFKIIYNVNSPNSTAPADAYRLYVVDGASASDVSPEDGSSVDYGPYGRSRWRIVSSMQDENTMIAVVMRQGDSGSRVFISDDGATSWTALTSDDTNYRRAAIAGDDGTVIYLWGASATLAYSEDSGTTISDKSGNLSALGAGEIIGICGGIA